VSDRDRVIETIREVFGSNEYPGDHFLQGSFEGCEPADSVGPFVGQEDWETVAPQVLDGAGALNFFSEAAFRFYMPAYMIADLREQLVTEDPVFHLTHAFHDISVEVPTESGTFVRKTGKSEFVNPRRYGAMTWYDYGRNRLSIFSREEAQAIVAYLKYRRASDPHGLNQESIDAALDSYWLDRASNAPLREDLKTHLKEEERFMRSINPDFDS
jgi:hypothetical protein